MAEIVSKTPKELAQIIEKLASQFDVDQQTATDTKKKRIELSNEFIFTVFTFLVCGGLEESAAPDWRYYVRQFLGKYSRVKSSLYHYGEVAETAQKNNITPSPEVNPSNRIALSRLSITCFVTECNWVI